MSLPKTLLEFLFLSNTTVFRGGEGKWASIMMTWHPMAGLDSLKLDKICKS